MKDEEPNTTPTEMNAEITAELKIQLNLDRSMHQVKRLSQETGLNGQWIHADLRRNQVPAVW